MILYQIKYIKKGQPAYNF